MTRSADGSTCNALRARLPAILLSTALVAAVAGCTGGDLSYKPKSVFDKRTAFDDMPGANVIRKAEPGAKTTSAETQDWQAKLESGKPFNDLKLKADVAVLPAEVVSVAKVEADAVRVPAAQAAELLALKPGAPLVGIPAAGDQLDGGKSNNYLGFLRKVKSVKQVGSEVVVQTEKAGLNDVLVGAGNLEFPAVFEELPLTDEMVDIRKILTDLPPALTPTDAGGAGSGADAGGSDAFDQKKGALTIDESHTESFHIGGSANLDQVYRVVESNNIPELKALAPGLQLDTWATGSASMDAKLEFQVYLKVIAGLYANGPALQYFRAGAIGEALFDAKVALNIAATFPNQRLEPEKGHFLRRWLAEHPHQWSFDLEIGSAKYYKGPKLPFLGLPTTFRLSPRVMCDVDIHGGYVGKGFALLKAKAEVFAELSALTAKGDSGFPTEFTKDYGWEDTFVQGGAVVRCFAGPRIDWLIADTAGPTFSLLPGVKNAAVWKADCPDPGKIGDPQPAVGKVEQQFSLGFRALMGLVIDLGEGLSKWTGGFIKVDAKWKWDFPVGEMFWQQWSKSASAQKGYGICPTTCQNGKKDGFESGIDCGGSAAGGGCPKCQFGFGCSQQSDCNMSYTCMGGTCGNLNCNTGKKEDYSTDVNCGGLCANSGFTCGVGKKCDKHADCDSKLCDWGTCATLQCNNKQTDWWETDVDCGGKFCPQCNGGLHCNNDSDCWGVPCQLKYALQNSSYGICIPGQCNMGMYFSGEWAKKGDMTDVMCGGACARGFKDLTQEACNYGPNNLLADKQCGVQAIRCKLGKSCQENGDCQSEACWNGTCVKAECSNGEKDPYETGVDCGGLCSKKCAVDAGCSQDADCQPGLFCVQPSQGGKVCAPCKIDGAQNGLEIDKDCGSACATKAFASWGCVLGQSCQVNADCGKGYQTTWEGKAIQVEAASCKGNKCVPVCQNNVFDKGYEGDVDCGGICPKKCNQGQGCSKPDDCITGACIGDKCASPCLNGKKDPEEAGVDCGKACNNKCFKGQTCGADDDCQTGMCLKGICGFDACLDKKLSGGESDVDCGGGCNLKCELTKGCKADKDCQSGWCDGKVCVKTQCEDKKQTAGEADIDCGGVCLPAQLCGLGKKCKVKNDCASTICSKLGSCVGDTCQDGLFSGNETDVDCGGSCKSKCTSGEGCKSGADCDSSYCDGTVCVGDFCSDKVLSQGESDVDCGGACSKKCTSGKKCTGGADCQSSYCKLDGTCASGPCEDGKKSAGEADVDCGGNCGTPCLVGKQCNGGADCASLLCAAVSLACVATTCQDEIQDAGETGIDCGGPCAAKCGLAKGCASNVDCQSGWCDGKQCVATSCDDKQWDNGEGDVDCGGPCAAKCALAAKCSKDGDCQSGYCDAVGKVCVDSACKDNHIDPGETDVDCGGACQATKTCALDKGCADGKDCASTVCAASNKCVATTCDDGKQTVNETGIDCGGACAQKCTAGQGCKGNGDCDSGFCSAAGKCVGGACEDGKLSAGESDVDCGGACTSKCATGKSCKEEADCVSGFCDATGGGAGICQATACTDKKKNVSETDVDCGGQCAVKCALDKGCKVGGDCNSGSCAASAAVCVADACLDETKNGDEADVDCGGSCTANCATGKGCSKHDDCQTGYCDGKACIADPCQSKQKDFGESDVDCGNVCSVKCQVGKGCVLAADCASSWCDGNQCVGTSCEDKKQDAGESDIDCGGPCSAKCAAGKGCAKGADCTSNLCAVVSAVCVTSTCADEAKGQDETDVDCGGSSCKKCTVGKGCSADGDCASGYCDGKVCVADHCLDKKKDVGETDIDCGGTCKQGCDNGLACALATDCTSAQCAAVSLACVATPCANEVKDGAETDVDCGGNVCSSKCATGKSCSANADCSSGWCNSTTSKCVATSCEDGAKSGDEVEKDCGGSCAGCADGVACAADKDCKAGVCIAAACGCPYGSLAMTVTTGGKKTVECARNSGGYTNMGKWGHVWGAVESEKVITDNVEKLMWVRVPYGSPPVPPKLKWAQALEYCDGLTWNGFDDWRLPTVAELNTTYATNNFNGYGPSQLGDGKQKQELRVVAAGYWPWANESGTAYDNYPSVWTASQLGNSANQHFVFDCSSASYMAYGCWLRLAADQSHHALCVRAMDKTPPKAMNKERFALSTDKTVIHDTYTQLYWSTASATMAQLGGNYYSAYQYCTNMKMLNWFWTPPTLNKLISIIEPWQYPFCEMGAVCPNTTDNFTLVGMAPSSYNPIDYCNGSCFGVVLHPLRLSPMSAQTYMSDGNEMVRCAYFN